ncbi:MAG: MBL fold metallo-hydrolase [Chloroflexi bacterium]|nr:MBL fold metallo-hydrolase [Chloroflexota bacterium]
MKHTTKTLSTLSILAITLAWLAACGDGGDETQTPTPTPVRTAESVVGMTVHFIDVGQGDATLIVAKDGESLLVDGGPSRETIRDRLTDLGVTDLDAILATHPDPDHIGGLVEVLDMFDVERFYWNGQTSESQTFLDLMESAEAEADLIVSRRGDTIALGNLTIKVLHPAELSGEPDEDSIVLEVGCGNAGILLTADAGTSSEAKMLRAGVLSRGIDIYRVGNHGSKSSTAAHLLSQTASQIAVISAGRTNEYGYPHPEVVNRLGASGSTVWRTDISSGDDTVTAVSDCETVSISQPPPALDPTPTPTAPSR